MREARPAKGRGTEGGTAPYQSDHATPVACVLVGYARPRMAARTESKGVAHGGDQQSLLWNGVVLRLDEISDRGGRSGEAAMPRAAAQPAGIKPIATSAPQPSPTIRPRKSATVASDFHVPWSGSSPSVLQAFVRSSTDWRLGSPPLDPASGSPTPPVSPSRNLRIGAGREQVEELVEVVERQRLLLRDLDRRTGRSTRHVRSGRPW